MPEDGGRRVVLKEVVSIFLEVYQRVDLDDVDELDAED